MFPPPGRAANPGDASQGRLDRHGEFHALREYASGDDPRSIHWRKSATAGRLMVRQNEDSLTRTIVVVLDNRQLSEPPDEATIEQQEAAVSHAASLAVHYIHHGYSVQLSTRTRSVPPGGGETQLSLILRTLALLEFTSDERQQLPHHPRGESISVRAGAASGPRQVA